MTDGLSGTAEAREGGNTAILVLGMHRSGTSAVTRLLSLLGFRLPATLVVPGAGKGPDSNTTVGFWESEVLMRVHDAVLADAGLRWDSPLIISDDWWTPEALKQWTPALCDAVTAEFDGPGPWVVKDPRMCQLLPLWLAALRDLRVEPAAVLIVRSPNEVAESLRVRDQIPRRHALLLWLVHTVAAERATRAYSRTFVRYEALLDDWQGEVTRIARTLGLELPCRVGEAAGEISRFLDPSLRHHTAGREAFDGDSRLEAVVAHAYDLMLSEAAEQRGSADDFDALHSLLTSEPRAMVRARHIDDSTRLEVLQEQVRAVVRTNAVEASHLAEIGARAWEVERNLGRLEQLLADDRTNNQGQIDVLGEGSSWLFEMHRLTTSRLDSFDESLRETSQDRQRLHDRIDELERGLVVERQRRSRLERALGALAPRGIAAPPGASSSRHRSAYGWWALARSFPRWLRSPGIREGLRFWREAREIDRSGAFDVGYYLCQNPEVARAGVDPLFHWVAVGARDGRDPSPAFQTASYLARHPELAASRENPLLHHLRSAGRDQCDPSDPAPSSSETPVTVDRPRPGGGGHRSPDPR